MEFAELVTSRRSVRGYLPDPLPEETLASIFDLARHAPSACNLQPWRFLLLSSRDWLDRVHAAYPRSWFMEAPHVLVVSGSVDSAWKRPADDYNSIETDLAIVFDHLTLAAWSLGVGTCWIANFEPEVLRKNLGLGHEDRVYAMTPLGWPDPESKSWKNPPNPRKELSELVVRL